jgi:hypothetical protein
MFNFPFASYRLTLDRDANPVDSLIPEIDDAQAVEAAPQRHAGDDWGWARVTRNRWSRPDLAMAAGLCFAEPEMVHRISHGACTGQRAT